MSWLEPISDRLAWTLAHFLWQALAWMGVCSAAIALFRIRDPALRYRVQFAALIGMAVSPIVTFAVLSMPRSVEPPPVTLVVNTTQERPLETPRANAVAPTAEITGSIPKSAASAPALPATIELAPPMEQPRQWPAIDLGNAAIWLVSAWLAGVVALGTWLVIGLLGTRRLRFGSSRAPAELTDRAARWAAAIGLRAVPAIVTSPKVREPMTAGLRRPVVLLPAGWPEREPKSVVDACLAHELAHLHRGDLWTNLLQRLIEAALYFHPCVWRLSARLRLDRELCCDAIAAEATGDRLAYVSALERVATLRLGWAIQPVALGVGGRRKTLLLRVCSLLGQAPKPRFATAAMTGLLAIATSLTIGLALVIQTPNLVASAPDTPVVEDEIAEPSTTIVGTVVDLAGKPVTGAEVLLIRDGRRVEPTLTTNDRGEFNVSSDWMKEDGGYDFIAKRGNSMGWFDVWANVHRKPPGRITLPRLMLLPRDRTIEGTLVDLQGRPLSGVPVEVVTLSHKTNATIFARKGIGEAICGLGVTDNEGRFRVQVPRDAEGSFRPRHPSYRSLQIWFKRDVDEIAPAALCAAGAVAGTVTDESGRPLPWARIGAQRLNTPRDGSGWGDARTDEKGRYTIAGLEPGKYAVIFCWKREDMKLIAPAHNAVVVEAGKTAAADFQTAPGVRLRGSVVDDNSKPMTGVEVTCRGPARPEGGPGASYTTGQRGEFFSTSRRARARLPRMPTTRKPRRWLM